MLKQAITLNINLANMRVPSPQTDWSSCLSAPVGERCWWTALGSFHLVLVLTVWSHAEGTGGYAAHIAPSSLPLSAENTEIERTRLYSHFTLTCFIILRFTSFSIKLSIDKTPLAAMLSVFTIYQYVCIFPFLKCKMTYFSSVYNSLLNVH